MFARDFRCIQNCSLLSQLDKMVTETAVVTMLLAASAIDALSLVDSLLVSFIGRGGLNKGST